MKKYLLCIALLFFAPTACGADFGTGLAVYNQRDFATAEREFRILANQGDPAAQFLLGVMFANRQGVSQGYVEASKWYHGAAEQGHVDAQAGLGQMYLDGQGVPQDIVKACAWWSVAAYGGSNFAAMSLELFETKLTFSQRQQVLELAREILSKKYSRE